MREVTIIRDSPQRFRAQTGWSALVAAGLLAAGCSGSGGASAPAGAAATPAQRTLLVLTPYPDIDAQGFAATLTRFEDQTGIKVQVRGAGGDFVDQLSDPEVRSQVDVAIFPQAGVMASVARSGDLVTIPESTARQAKQNVYPALAEAGQVDGKAYGIPVRAWASLGVIYRSDVFEQNGWTFPTTWEGLDSLSEQIRAKGLTPWCLGVGAGGATGWPLKSFLEAYVVSHAGQRAPELIQDWISHRVKASDPPIREGVAWVAQLMQEPGWSTPTGPRILTTPVEKSHDPMFASKPGCLMGYGLTFMTSGYPKNWQDLTDFAPFPPAVGTDPVLMGGADLAAAFRSDASTRALMTYLASTKDFGIEWARKGGYLGVTPGIAPGLYPAEAEQTAAKSLAAATTLVPDAADSMPTPVGSGTYWKGLSSLAYPGTTVDQAIATMESGWSLATSSPASPG